MGLKTKMNIYLYELKNNRKFAIMWAMITLVLTLMMIYFYPMIKEQADAFVDIMSKYPVAIQNAFGINTNFATTPLGYYSTFPYVILIICVTLEAMLLGLNVIYKETKDKTSDFLFTKPVTRAQIFLSKILASITLLMLNNIFVLLLIYLSLVSFASVDLYLFFLICLAIIMLQMFFFIFGALLATIIPKIKSTISLAMAVVLGFYTISTFGKESIRFFNPFQYIKANDIITNRNYEMPYFYLLIVLILLCTISAYNIYIKKDIK